MVNSLILFNFHLVRARFGFNDNYVISGSEDCQVYIWDLKSKLLVGTLGSPDKSYGHVDCVNEVATIG
jgi:WD40 repeat protein